MDKETLFAENDALRKMNQHIADRTDRLEKAIGAALGAEDLAACKDVLRAAVRK